MVWATRRRSESCRLVCAVTVVRPRCSGTDTAGALVTFLGLPEGATTATITSTSQLFRPVLHGTVRAVAVTLHLSLIHI